MLVLLVSEDHVVVDDAHPAPDGEPLSHLLFDGPPVEGAGGCLLPGPDVYRLVGRVDLVAAYGRDIVESPLSPASHLAELRALPVYLELSADAARAWHEAAAAGHPSVPTARPHLQLAPPLAVKTGLPSRAGLLRAEAARARADAAAVARSDPRRACELLEAAVGYERAADGR